MSRLAPVLEASDLAVVIAGHDVCRGLSFAVGPGECWAVVGPNGGGKTTLLRTLAGFRAPRSGAIRYRGRPLDALSPRERAVCRGVLAQDSQDAFPASVLDCVLIGRHPHLSRFAFEGERDIALATNALARMGLADLGERDVRTLSGGERRRVALAALLVQDPALFLLDEPSSHLDVARQVEALDVFTGLARESGKAIVMVLHDLHLAARYCDHAVAVGAGVAHAGASDELLEAEALSRLFGRTLRELGSGRARAFVPD